MLRITMSNPTVHVFTCSNPEFNGFSLKEDGTATEKAAA
jgi:hypothetical protein